LIDDIINSVNTIIYRAVTAVETGLLAQPATSLGFAADKSSTDLSIRDADGDGNVEYPEARQEIENGVHQLETLLEATVDKDFDKFEIFALRSILSVPEELRGWIRLSHYEVIKCCFTTMAKGFVTMQEGHVDRVWIELIIQQLPRHSDARVHQSATAKTTRDAEASDGSSPGIRTQRSHDCSIAIPSLLRTIKPHRL